MADFDGWNELKKETDSELVRVFLKERDIFWTRCGKNIGFEQNGKGEYFLRPVVVLKKFNADIFWGVPLTTAVKKDHKYYFEFTSSDGQKSLAIISQLRIFDAKRLSQKMRMISENDFFALKNKIVALLKIESSPRKGCDPEGICT